MPWFRYDNLKRRSCGRCFGGGFRVGTRVGHVCV